MNDVIAQIMPNTTPELQEQLDAVDVGAIRSQIVEILQEKGYKIQEQLNYLIINEKVEIQLSDAIIKDLTVLNEWTPIEIVEKIVLFEYDYLILQPE